MLITDICKHLEVVSSCTLKFDAVSYFELYQDGGYFIVEVCSDRFSSLEEFCAYALMCVYLFGEEPSFDSRRDAMLHICKDFSGASIVKGGLELLSKLREDFFSQNGFGFPSQLQGCGGGIVVYRLGCERDYLINAGDKYMYFCLT